jgi:hypothetical protein
MSIAEILNFIIEKSEYNSLLSDLIVGILLVFIFFLYKEKVSPIIDISGVWYSRTNTLKTVNNPFRNMILGYKIFVLQEGQKLEGTIEKIYENSTTGEREYIGNKRTRAYFKGYVERNFLGKNKIQIHVIEKGIERESTIYYVLYNECNNLKGEFFSTAGDSEGTTIWQRTPFH